MKNEDVDSADYILGPIKSLDMKWAESVVDYNQKLDCVGTNFTKIEREDGQCSNSSCIELHKKLMHLQLEHVKQSKLLEKSLDTSLLAKIDAEMSKLDLSVFKDESIKLEELLDAMYTVLYEIFGPDANLTRAFEEFADLYLKREATHEIKLEGLMRQLETYNRILGTGNNLSEVIQQKTNIIDSLVEQLKNVKTESTVETDKLRQQVNSLTREAAAHAQEVHILRERFQKEKAEMGAILNANRREYMQLLMDQQILVSQIPLANIITTNNLSALSCNEAKSQLESLVPILYQKDASSQQIIQKKDEEIAKLSAKVQALDTAIREWETDAIQWLEFVDRVKLLKPNV